MKIAIIKYGAGNTQSVSFALERLGAEVVITDQAEEIASAAKVVFPGVGEAATAMKYLQEKSLDHLLPRLRQPVLGICLGMQLLCRHTEEGDTTGLGIFDTSVKRFRSGKVPHMGWNSVAAQPGALLEQLDDQQYLYFVHSYYAEICADTVGVTEYGQPFSSVLQRDNFYGVQFHPEKSAAAGSRIIQNFLAL